MPTSVNTLEAALALAAHVSALSADGSILVCHSGAVCWTGTSAEPPRRGAGVSRRRAFRLLCVYGLLCIKL